MTLRFLAAGVAALAMSTAAWAQTASVSFTLTNNTGYVLTHIYVSLPSTESWEEDILGDQVVGDGESVEVTVDDGLESCEYDVRFDFSDGDSYVEYGVDFCEIDGEEFVIG